MTLYLDYFGLNEPPFRITPHTDFFFRGAHRGETLEALLYALTHDEGIIKVSGEVGSGKTMLCRVLIERLPKSVETVYLANPSLSRDEILIAIADDLGLSVAERTPTRLLRALQDRLVALYSEGHRVVLLIDEAHAMPTETLEEIRLLSNLESSRHKLLQIVLFGQPELDRHLDTPAMRQLKERITHSFRLEPLPRRDVESYVDFRLRAAGYRGPPLFTAGALRRIASASSGLTRRVNILADKALLAAFAAGEHAVTEAHVRRAIRDSEFRRLGRRTAPLALGAAALAAGFALGWAIRALLPATAPQPAQAGVTLSPAAQAATPATSTPNAAPSAAAERKSASPAKAPALPAASALPETPAPLAAAQAARKASAAEHQHPRAPARGDFTRERFEATQRWLATAPGDHYSIQLMTAKSSELPRMEEFLQRAAQLVPADELYVYSVKIDGEQYYRAAYGSYSDAKQALAEIAALPPLLRAQQPFYRSIARMRSQNRQ